MHSRGRDRVRTRTYAYSMVFIGTCTCGHSGKTGMDSHARFMTAAAPGNVDPDDPDLSVIFYFLYKN